MAQFDVHRNPGRHRNSIPFVVIVQSSLYDDYRRRVVVPLVRESALGNLANPRLNPTFQIEDQRVVLHPFEIVSVGTESLGEWVVSLQESGDKIISAMDELLTRWR